MLSQALNYNDINKVFKLNTHISVQDLPHPLILLFAYKTQFKNVINFIFA